MAKFLPKKKKGLASANRQKTEPLEPKGKLKDQAEDTIEPQDDEMPMDAMGGEMTKGKISMSKPKNPMMPPMDEAEAEDNPEEEAAPGDESSGITKPDAEPDKIAKEEEDELQEEIDANFCLAEDAHREWIEEAKEDIEFKSGTQWTPEDKATLEDQGRPCLTFNKIRPVVKLLTGHFIQNSSRIQVSPEGGEDQRFAETADRAIQFIDEQSQLEFNLGYLFSGGETTGRAYLELYMDYEKDPIFGELRSLYHGKPGTIYVDPRCNTYDINQSAQFVFKLVKKSKSELKELYPDKEKEIDDIYQDSENPSYGTPGKEGDRNNYGIAPGTNKTGINSYTPDSDKPTLKQYHVKEYWRNKLVDRWFAYFIDTGDMVKFDTEEEMNAEIEKRHQAYIAGGGMPGLWNPITKKRQRKEMWVAVRCGHQILANGKSPFEPHYTGYPFFQFIADWTPEAENEVDAIQGIVRGLKDPQREKNKSRSQFLHIINTAANSGWIGDNDALDINKRDELRSFGSTPGITIWKKPGSSLQRIEPVAAPMSQQVREKAASDDFKEVSGINSDLLAVDESSNPSGKAIALRIRQAITILEPDFRNFRYTKKLIGTCLMQIFPTIFDVAKLKKILGEQFMTANGVDDVYLKVFLVMIEDMKYNIKVAEHGDTKTSREETFEDLMGLMEKGIQIPFEIMAEYMTIPNKQEVIGKVVQYQQAQAQAAQAQAGAPGMPGR